MTRQRQHPVTPTGTTTRSLDGHAESYQVLQDFSLIDPPGDRHVATPHWLGEVYACNHKAVVTTRHRRKRAPWVPPPNFAVNPAGLELLRELLEVLGLLLECTVSGKAANATIDSSFENAGTAVGELRKRVRALASLLRVTPRLIKSDF
jgi:hypothetical protein